MADDERLEELLVDWDLSRQSGDEPSVEPELALAARRRVEQGARRGRDRLSLVHPARVELPQRHTVQHRQDAGLDDLAARLVGKAGRAARAGDNTRRAFSRSISHAPFPAIRTCFGYSAP